MRRVLFVALAVGLFACGDNTLQVPADAALAPDAQLEGFAAPDLVCPGGPTCASAGDGVLKVGVGKRVWTPPITETYTDENMDREWTSNEPYDDANGNGKFDAVWVFGGGRAAQAVLTDVEARAMAFVQGDLKIVVLSIDATGMLSPDMDKIRNHPNLAGVDVDQIIITATHAHNAPDTVGLWGPTATVTGRVDSVLDRLYDQASLAVKDALANPVPATMVIASTKLINDPSNPQSLTDDFNKDIRDPVIFDPTLTIARFVKADAPTETIGTLVNWADHPEIQNFAKDVPTMVSAHYVHYLRDGIENGVGPTDSLYAPQAQPGLGGVTVFVQGALGGQIGSIRGTHPLAPDGTPVTHEGDPQERAIGINAAAKALVALSTAGESTSVLPLSFKSALFHARVENTFLNVAFIVGLLGRNAGDLLVGWNPDEAADVGNYPWIPIRSTYLQVGPLGMVSVPGELHPELWVGVHMDGSWSWGYPLYDPTKPNLPTWDEAPAPPYMRDLVLAHDGVRYPVCIGLAFQYIGYIVPAYNFVLDAENPYIVEAEGDHYEEVYALSPLVEQQAIHPILDLLRYRAP